jgi:hypothetical protein
VAEDPNVYELCLGIAHALQPPSHYRLLDVGLFESAPEIIQRAADRQALCVRTSGSAVRPDLLAALLAEIESARGVLSDPEAREQYDRHLCAATFPPAVARPTPPPPAPRIAGDRRIDPAAAAAPRGSVLSQIMSLLRPHERPSG